MVSELLRLDEELEATPTAADMNDQGEYWASQYQELFGSWNAALEAVGLETNEPGKIPTDDLLNEIRRLAEDLERSPTKEQMNDLGEYWGKTYRLRFGSWSEAIRQAGLEPNQRIPESKFQERPETCPLCGEVPNDELDFHHWRYGENKAGCYLCRDCHDRVHADGARPEANPDWLMHGVENLIAWHSQYHEDTSATTIAERYNIPSEQLVEDVLSEELMSPE